MISVCIPTYNGEKYIYAQLISIIQQLSTEDEVIISDDSSSDKTTSIIKSINDPRIKLFENNSFHSPIYNLENALLHARGDYIFLSDQDDIWKNDKVECCLKYLKENNLVVHDADIIDGNNNFLFSSFYNLNHTKSGKIYNLIKNGYIGCCMAFHRSVLESISPFPKKLPMHDSWIGNMIAFNYGKVIFIKEKLISYRRHGENASNSGGKSKQSMKKRFSDRIVIIYNVLLRHNNHYRKEDL